MKNIKCNQLLVTGVKNNKILSHFMTDSMLATVKNWMRQQSAVCHMTYVQVTCMYTLWFKAEKLMTQTKRLCTEH